MDSFNDIFNKYDVEVIVLKNKLKVKYNFKFYMTGFLLSFFFGGGFMFILFVAVMDSDRRTSWIGFMIISSIILLTIYSYLEKLFHQVIISHETVVVEKLIGIRIIEKDKYENMIINFRKKEKSNQRNNYWFYLDFGNREFEDLFGMPNVLKNDEIEIIKFVNYINKDFFGSPAPPPAVPAPPSINQP